MGTLWPVRETDAFGLTDPCLPMPVRVLLGTLAGRQSTTCLCDMIVDLDFDEVPKGI
jgi:hypothetical protein